MKVHKQKICLDGQKKNGYNEKKKAGGRAKMSKYTGYTEAGKIASMKYKKNNIGRIIVDVQKTKKDEYKAKAERKGLSLTAYIVRLIENDPE